jgi:hypothetical protein
MGTRANIFATFGFIFVLISGCDKNDNSTSPAGTTPVNDGSAIPRFVGINYIELDKIFRISKFRSTEGHDYSDAFETCRSMKHYFNPENEVDWSAIKIYSPVTGNVSRIFEEWAGTQIQIQSKSNPDYFIIIFHINMSKSLSLGDSVSAGQVLGTHIGSQTMSDIAVGRSSQEGWKLFSFFDVMTDSLFETYRRRGIASRETMIISKQARDADTVRCSGETFMNGGRLENWIYLQ